MSLFLIIISIISGVTSLCFLIKFLQYFVNNYYFLKLCKKEKGTISRWVPLSSSHSARSSWWSSGSDWSPVIEYYDTSLGAIQEHDAVLPKHCTLDHSAEDVVLEIEYIGRHVRVTDERFVDVNMYSGSYFFLAFIGFVIVCAISVTVYLTL